MLKPQANHVRSLISLDGLWNFSLASCPDIDAEQAWTKIISHELQIPVPASYNDIFIDARIKDHIGWVYYQRKVIVPRTFSDQRYYLRFDAATHHGRVYINDDFVGEHIGGYTPFEIGINDIVAPGQEFRLTVAVSNELTWETLPPGRIENLATGKRKQHYQHDFFNYSGLARSVWLFSVPSQYIKDVTVVTDVELSEARGTIKYEVQTNEPICGRKIKVSLSDEEGRLVSESTEQTGFMNIEAVHLWQPGAAYLYRFRAEILAGDEIVDAYDLLVGVRSVEVAGNQFLINGKPFYFTGFGKHEDTPIRGKGHDPVYMVHDFQLMKWMGANSFRTSHYPYAEEVLEYADRHGILVINETAAVGLNLAIVAGITGQKAPPTFSPETVSAKTQATHLQAIRELVARDKNHPSVVMWCLANEPASADPGARDYFEPLVTLARELDPTRPIGFANEKQAGVEEDIITDLFDVICLNRYYGWYLNTGDLEAAEIAMEQELLAWQERYGKPMILSEYGADTLAGLHTVMDVPWGEEYQTRVLEMTARVLDRVDCIVGEHVWNFADFQTPSCFIFRVDGNKKGVFTRDRRPKAAVQTLRKRWTDLSNLPRNGL
ncbi:hypothetical protein ACHAQA_000080 [Verticillium albo-atrum]